jgi:hypothetical protein
MYEKKHVREWIAREGLFDHQILPSRTVFGRSRCLIYNEASLVPTTYLFWC